MKKKLLILLSSCLLIFITDYITDKYRTAYDICGTEQISYGRYKTFLVDNKIKSINIQRDKMLMNIYLKERQSFLDVLLFGKLNTYCMYYLPLNWGELNNTSVMFMGYNVYTEVQEALNNNDDFIIYCVVKEIQGWSMEKDVDKIDITITY